jgi:hypothetical protein
LLIWIYCKPLKSHKTAKTFFGKAWHWNHTSLEILGVRPPVYLEGFNEGREAVPQVSMLVELATAP